MIPYKSCSTVHTVCIHINIDRTTVIGKQIDAYLQQKVELPDPAVHLLFAANRWELV